MNLKNKNEYLIVIKILDVVNVSIHLLSSNEGMPIAKIICLFLIN